MKKLDKMLRNAKMNKAEPYIDYKFSQLTTEELKEISGYYGEVSEDRIREVLEPIQFAN